MEQPVKKQQIIQCIKLSREREERKEGERRGGEGRGEKGKGGEVRGGEGRGGERRGGRGSELTDLLMNSMTTITFHHREAMSLCMLLNNVSYFPVLYSRFY